MKEIFRKFWNGWKKTAHAIGRFNTKVLLTIIYFLILSPIGALMRLFGWDPLRSGKKWHKAGTNWQEVKQTENIGESLRRQS